MSVSWTLVCCFVGAVATWLSYLLVMAQVEGVYPELRHLQRSRARRRALLRCRPKFLLIPWVVLSITACVGLVRVLHPPLYRYFELPGTACVMLSVALVMFLSVQGQFYLFRPWMRRSLRLHIRSLGVPLCLECGYDLRGLEESIACPECGSSIKGMDPLGNMQTPASTGPER